jgi:hypothetical protein
MRNKRNVISLLSLVCAWQLDLEAAEAFFVEEAHTTTETNQQMPIAEHSTDAWDAILKELYNKKNKSGETA